MKYLGNPYKFLLFAIVLILLTSISAKTKTPESIYPHKIYKNDDPNVTFESHLQGKTLKFINLKTGMNISLNSIIVMTSISDESFLSIEFPRTMLTNKFIEDLFYHKDQNIMTLHPFAKNGIEAILIKDKLVLNIHSGVVLHLRNDIKYFPNYKTFKSGNVTGKVTKIKGKVFSSFDHLLIKEKLKDIFIQWKGPRFSTKPDTKEYRLNDGSYRILMPKDKSDIPPKYPPKKLE